GKPAPKVKANPAKAKIARRKLAKVQAAAATLAPCQVKDGTAPPRPCLLCDDKEHQAHRCPFWRQCVTIKGAKERDRDALWKYMQQSLEVQMLNFNSLSQLFLARLGSTRQARLLCSLGMRGVFRAGNQILRVYPFRGDKSVEAAPAAAPAAEPAKRKRSADKPEATGEAPSGPKASRQ
ncbi:unnamed protein product, partial [Effrenium voratum]